jgi:DNA mismatch repair protein MutS
MARLHANKPDLKQMKLFDLNEEMHFYLGYFDFIKSMKSAGYGLCVPSWDDGGMFCSGAYDLSLAVRLTDDKSPNSLISNDADISAKEGFVLTGANQGGKTTYLRSVGICAYLANLGVPVPATSCRIKFIDDVHTHFPRDEEAMLRSRLEDEVKRFKATLDVITGDSLILMNESFIGTRRSDGVELTIRCMDVIMEAGCMFGCVTHYYELFNELASAYPGRVSSLEAEVDETEGNRRVYRIRKSIGVSAYADDIVAAVGMTYNDIKAMKSGGGVNGDN